MTWNWQQLDWPNFTWDAARLDRAEEHFVLRAGVFMGTVKHLSIDDRDQVTVELMGDEGITTSKIEGETLSRDSVQSSIRRELGLATDPRRIPAAERGIGELMVDLYRNFATPLDHESLFNWHRMVMRGRDDLRDLGRYRTHAEPMQVVSGELYAPKVHFEAPPSNQVSSEMSRFLEWFDRTAPQKTEALPALTRAGIAHIYFESIHPFEDGNGRIGRAISERVLAQSLGQPSLTAISTTILAHRRSYYDALRAANRGTELTLWLAWFAAIGLEAQQRTIAHVEFVIHKTKLLDRVRNQLNERQRTVLARVFREGPEGFKGGLSAGKYISIAKTSAATARRDLGELVDMAVLSRTGERRHARYHPLIPAHPIPTFSIDERGSINESRLPAP